METTDIVEQIRNEGRDKGRTEGRVEGRREMLLELYASRFGDVPPEIRKAVKRTRSPSKLQAWLPIVATGTASEIAAAVSPPKRDA